MIFNEMSMFAFVIFFMMKNLSSSSTFPIFPISLITVFISFYYPIPLPFLLYFSYFSISSRSVLYPLFPPISCHLSSSFLLPVFIPPFDLVFYHVSLVLSSPLSTLSHSLLSSLPSAVISLSFSPLHCHLSLILSSVISLSFSFSPLFSPLSSLSPSLLSSILSTVISLSFSPLISSLHCHLSFLLYSHLLSSLHCHLPLLLSSPLISLSFSPLFSPLSPVNVVLCSEALLRVSTISLSAKASTLEVTSSQRIKVGFFKRALQRTKNGKGEKRKEREGNRNQEKNKNEKKTKEKEGNHKNKNEECTYLAMETFCLSPPESLAPLSPTEVCIPLGSLFIVSNKLHFSMAWTTSSDVAEALPYLRER